MFSIDFAHPVMIPGHPLKGGGFPLSQGMLLNPEIKRFAISCPLFFKPVRPGTGPSDSQNELQTAESPEKLVEAYTGTSSVGSGEKCEGYFSNLQKCFSSIKSKNKDPEVHCQYYIQGLKREGCAN